MVELVLGMEPKYTPNKNKVKSLTTLSKYIERKDKEHVKYIDTTILIY